MTLWRMADQHRRTARAFGMAWLCALLLPACLGDFLTREQLLAELDAGAADAQLGDGDAATTADGDAADVRADADASDAADSDADDDAATDDVAVDAPDAAQTCPAAPGCACKDGSKCASGACFTSVDFTSADLSKGCAAPCSVDNPCADPDTVCMPFDVSPTLQSTLCVPRWETLCDPCLSSDACVSVGQPGAKCLNFGPSGNYCGTPCQSALDCAKGYGCEVVNTVENAPALQCVPLPADATSGIGECTCSNIALHKKLSTTCYVPSYDNSGALVGKCTGVRSCDVDSLTDCSAPKPKPEVCDTFDNNCNGLIDEGTCNDANPCTTDFCAGAADCTHTTLDGNACDDGSACTLNDVCIQTTCVGTPHPCLGSACVSMKCDPSDGTCDSQIKADTTPCDDGNACTSGDICLAGNCSGGSVTCDDTNPCTNDSCTPKGGCAHDPNASLCNDNSACTQFDQCVDGVCIGTAQAGACDDGNPCTDDSCENTSGCAHLANAGTCTDGNACTLGDYCQGGQCLSGVNECSCTQDADCKPKEDGDLCNGTLYCDTTAVPFQCLVKPSTIVTCVASNSPCRATACVPASGACTETTVADGITCDADGSVCTVGDACLAGTCTAGPQKVCNDGNVCTDDACDPLIGCTKTPNSAPCSDSNACTVADTCQGGACVSGVATVCNDNNPCTADACDPLTGGCLYPATSGPCDDGDPCTTGDTCDPLAGTCTSGAPMQCISATKCANGACDAATGNCTFTQVVCDDGNLCTNDSCDAATGCVFAPKSCDDGNACTVDTCDTKTGACVYSTLTCDDGNPCTADSCSAKTGCFATNVADGTVCSGIKICVAGACKQPFAAPPANQGGVWGGSASTCVRVWGGGEDCWGAGTSGQLGDGSSKDRATPGPVSNLAAVGDGDCGNAFACAIRGTTNTTRCWGANGSGQLGNGSTTASPVPVDVVTTATAPAIPLRVTTGGAFACEIMSTHKAWCWGDNSHQQLGGGVLAIATGNAKTPTAVSGLTNVTAIAAGTAHVCAVQGGAVYCWGLNKDGECGQAGTADVNAPAQVGGLGNITAITAGDDFSCALAGGSGNVWCWGSNLRGQLATGSVDSGGVTPVQIGVTGITDFSAGLGHVCARGTTGNLVCWGRNEAGQVGNGSQSDALLPTTLNGVSNAYRIGAGDSHTCMVRLDGSVWCWGSNASGALGSGSIGGGPALLPAQVIGTSPK